VKYVIQVTGRTSASTCVFSHSESCGLVQASTQEKSTHTHTHTHTICQISWCSAILQWTV